MMTRERSEASRRRAERAARIGYGIKGTLYILVGVLAVAVGAAAGVGDARNVVDTAGDQPFGRLLLVLVGVGLLGYAVFRVAEVYTDPDRVRAERGGGLKRVGYVISGVVYGLLGIAALEMASHTGGAGPGRQTYLARLLAVDVLGPLIAVIAGAVVIGVALYELYEAATVRFGRLLRLGEMSERTHRFVVRIGRVGLAAHGVVFLVIGLGFIRAALSASAGRANSFGEALREIGARPFGAVLLVAVAMGLVAYGTYQIAMARYRRIPGA